MNDEKTTMAKLTPMAIALGTGLALSLSSNLTHAHAPSFTIKPLASNHANDSKTHQGTCGAEHRKQMNGACGSHLNDNRESQDSNVECSEKTAKNEATGQDNKITNGE